MLGFKSEMSDDYKAALHAECTNARLYKSAHADYMAQFGLSEDKIYELCPDVFEACGFER